MGRYQWGDEMSIGCQSFIRQMEQWAPLQYAEEWDNPGLQVGRREKILNKIMVALTPGEAAVDAAIQAGADMLFTHHPLIFKPVKQINSDTATGRILLKLIQHDINLYCAHTNLDIANGGVNDVLANALQLQDIQPLADLVQEVVYYKVVVYVPVGYEEAVRQAMCNAGAGCTGGYSTCTFQARGTGTFLPGENTNPFIGEAGRLEYADEYRLETIVPQPFLHAVIAAMKQAHPYEEVGYDVFRLENDGPMRGIGRVGQLKAPVTLEQFLAFTGQQLQCDHLTYQGDLQKSVQRVALCGGSGISYLKAAKKAGADVYVTGDMKYHDGQLAGELGVSVVDAGHFGTERLITQAMAEFVRQQGAEAVVFEEQDYLHHWVRTC